MGLEDVDLVKNMFETLSYDELLKCRDNLNSAISKSYEEMQRVVHSHKPSEYVEYVKSFLGTDSVEYSGVCAELESLHMKPQRSGAPESKWLTSTNLPYTWDSRNGHKTVKSSVDISKYPFIKQVMEDINSEFNADLNSCLINYYKSGNSAVRYHDDSEEDIDQSQPICILSVGSERTIDFLYRDQHHRCTPIHSVTPVDGSLYTMKSGCQQLFKHSVRRDQRVGTERFCLSFRRRYTADDTKLSTSVSTQPGTNPSPVKEMVRQFESGIVNSGITTIKAKIELGDVKPPSPPQPSIKRKNTTVIFGTSITSRIVGPKLATRGRKVINVSRSGAKIKDILLNMENFHAQHPSAPYVDKILFSLGTNDIKYSRHGVFHLKQVVINLISKAKELFPGSIIMFQSCLPIKILYRYTCKNVLNFNDMIRNLCGLYNCIYVDCFRYFLSRDGYDYNRSLYYDWLHLNDEGLGVLARCLSAVVNRGSFNHVFNNFWGHK